MIKVSKQAQTALLFFTFIFQIATAAPALSQSLEQWTRMDKSMADLIADDFVVKSVVAIRVRPVTTDEIQFYLSKDKRLVRCTETVVRKRGVSTTQSLLCSELSQPKPQP